MLLSEAIESYIRYARVEEGLSPTTLLNYQNRLRYYRKWLLANGYAIPDITTLNSATLRRYLYFLSEQKQRPRTIKGKFACLDALCRFLIYTEVMETNPTDKIKLPKLDAARRLLVTDEEIAALFDACDKRRNPRMVALARAVLTVFAHAGVRRAEARNLCVEVFNAQDRSVLIHHGNNSKSRNVFVSHNAYDALNEYVAVRSLQPSAPVQHGREEDVLCRTSITPALVSRDMGVEIVEDRSDARPQIGVKSRRILKRSGEHCQCD